MNQPKIGFVSLGCPKALVDSERILTQLKLDGYSIVPRYQEADVVVVNTCGFIDSAKQESLDAIGEALHENGRVIVTGCMGVMEEEIRRVHPRVLSVTGPQAYEAVVGAVHQHVPPPPRDHDPFLDLVPPQGVKLTPRHYAYLKISEGCNHRCSFCIIPQLRGDLVSRPIGEVMDEAERLVKAGVRELLVISQDTSAYGVDLHYRTGFWQGRPLRTRMQELCEALGSLGVWVRLHYVYPYPHVDQLIPLMAGGRILPYLDIPFQHASRRILKLMKRPANADGVLERIREWRALSPELPLRSPLTVGYPAQNETQIQEPLDFLPQAEPATAASARGRRRVHRAGHQRPARRAAPGGHGAQGHRREAQVPLWRHDGEHRGSADRGGQVRSPLVRQRQVPAGPPATVHDLLDDRRNVRPRDPARANPIGQPRSVCRRPTSPINVMRRRQECPRVISRLCMDIKFWIVIRRTGNGELQGRRQNRRARGKRHAAEFDWLGGHAVAELVRAFEAQDFLDRGLDQVGMFDQPLLLLGIAGQRHQPVSDQVGGGFMAGVKDEHAVLQQF